MLNFTKIHRETPNKRDVMQRLKDFDEVYELFDKSKAREQSSRCMQCGDPYCHSKCPLHNIIPAWLKQTAQKDLELAFNISNETSPFPEILGRICPQDVLCEGDCSLNDTHGAITIGSVETHISEIGFDNGLIPKFTDKKIGKKVAVIGSGPAGMSAATFLLRAGVEVEMFERSSRAGGLLTYGIPGFKLDKIKVQRRVDILVDAGMKLYLNCEIGKDKSFEDLEKEFDAIFIGIGATKGRSAGLEGEQSLNVYKAMDFLISVQKRNFLKDSNNNHKNEKNEKFINVKDRIVVVIGGGDTAMDCVRSAVREGAKEVKCLYRRDEINMPGSKKEVLNAKEEGVEFVFNVAPKAIITNSGILATALKLQKTQLSQPDINGRQKLSMIENSEYIQEVDIIIYALGFDQELPAFIKNINLDKWNGIKVNESFQTSNSKVYAGGDGVRGADLAVRAAADGKAAAKAIVESFS